MDKEKELKNMNNTPEENGGAMEGASATGVNGVNLFRRNKLERTEQGRKWRVGK